MNLIDQASQDLNFTLEDQENGFGTPVVLTDENNVTYNLNCQTTDIGFFIDPGTGVGMSGRTGEINFSLASLHEQGGAIPKKGWKFRLVSVNDATYNFTVQTVDVDRKIGLVKITIGVVVDGQC